MAFKMAAAALYFSVALHVDVSFFCHRVVILVSTPCKVQGESRNIFPQCSVRQVCLQQNAFQSGDKNILPRFFFNICDIQNIPLKQLRKFPQSYSFLMATPWFQGSKNPLRLGKLQSPGNQVLTCNLSKRSKWPPDR